MKTLIAIALTLFAGRAAYASGDSLKDHMREMSYILESARLKSSSAGSYAEAAALMREMRSHTIAAAALIPQKVLELEEKPRNLAMIEYHQLISRLIYMTASVENALSNDDYEVESYSKEHDIENLLTEIGKLMSYAHEKFR